MTKQEKAMQLISKFVSLGFTLEASKECALIAVDEILKVCEKEITNCSDKTFFYWQEVKQEIEKI